MPEWLATALAAAVPALVLVAVAWGALSTKVRRLEEDVAKCVTREVYAAQHTAIEQKLARIEQLSERLLDRVTGYARTPRPDDDSGSHRIPPR